MHQSLLIARIVADDFDGEGGFSPLHRNKPIDPCATAIRNHTPWTSDPLYRFTPPE